MKKKFLLVISLALLVTCFFAISISAAATNELGTPEAVEGIDLTGMNTDTVARVVIVDASGEYHTYLTSYILSSDTKFKYNFSPINNALGTSYTKNSVVRIEVPDNIEIAANCGDLCSCAELLEIKFFPTSELHTLEYGCFYNNRKLQKLNIPKKVTTMGTLLINYSTLEELVFDDGFCAVPPKDSFKGASGLKKIVFSNQMTTVEDRAFDSTLGTSLEELYLGASLKDLGTNNMAWVKQSVKIYAPAQLLSEVGTITMETYSWWASSACLPTGVIFFTGSLEQAQALIDKSEYDRLFCKTAELVRWDSSIADDDYVPKSGWKIVYNYGLCNAFYGGEHMMTGNDTVSLTDYFTEIKIGDICTRQGCGMGTVKKTIAPIFECLGVSSTEKPDAQGKYSITLDYKVDFGAYNEYLEYGTLDFGLVVCATQKIGVEPLMVENGQVVAKEPLYTVLAAQSKFAHDYVSLKLIGIGADKNGTELVMSMYVYDGEKISYLNDLLQISISE